MNYINKLAAIRQEMKERQLAAYLIASADPHGSEVLPDHYKALEFTCGFTGSAGTLVITDSFAGLWTDFRYFIQAEEELKDSGFELVKLKVQHTPEYIAYLASVLAEGSEIGFDYQLFSVQLGGELLRGLKAKNINCVSADLISPIWQNRPPLPNAAATLIPAEDAGRSVAEKIIEVRAAMTKQPASHHLISSLDDIAWLFNLRGGDINHNPVVLSHALIGPDSVKLFIAEGKLSATHIWHLQQEGVTVESYHNLRSNLLMLPAAASILLDPKRCNFSLYDLLPAEVDVQLAVNPSTHLKSIKNEIELAQVRKVMVKDGVALTRFFKWLEEHVGKEPITEISAADQLEAYRAQQENFAGVSFDTIAGYQAHAALPHYHATPASDVLVLPEGLFLVDSGGQYHYGTTDVTRSIPMGLTTAQQQEDYTLVLKALICGSKAVFPEGTRGYQIDAICRQPLWLKGINYGHGTGHGIGFYLNVHEGPQNIGPSNVPVALQPGMITSIEPGIYRPGSHGVRTENLVLTIIKSVTEFGVFHAFETLTLAHIDTQLVKKELLEQAEVTWLNDYNQQVYVQLCPFLQPEEAKWLQQKCLPI
ncbi:Xaa-Pro aminopeptidase [Pedobacter sp. CAN_A7]|uniref:aminopeptidase P family protein n=1 Tax=Pedobacter sp. CAN_A7 TaxID=2787722 RepID=UPI0018CB40B0